MDEKIVGYSKSVCVNGNVLLHVTSCGSLVRRGQRSCYSDNSWNFDVRPARCAPSRRQFYPAPSRTDLVQFAEVKRSHEAAEVSERLQF